MKDLENSPDREPKLKIRRSCYKSINDRGNPRGQKVDYQISIENQRYMKKNLSSRRF